VCLGSKSAECCGYTLEWPERYGYLDPLEKIGKARAARRRRPPAAVPSRSER